MSVNVDLCRSMLLFDHAFGWPFDHGRALAWKDPANIFGNCGSVTSWVEADELPGSRLLRSTGQDLVCFLHALQTIL